MESRKAQSQTGGKLFHKESIMKHKALAPPLALILLLSTAPFAKTQTKNVDQSVATTSIQAWQLLSSLKRGKQVLIEFKSDAGRTAEGKFVSVSGTKLTLSEDGSDVTVEQSDIQRVYRLQGRWSRSKTARIGAGIGMLVGTFIGVSRSISREREVGHVGGASDTTPSFAGFYLGTLAGAGLGALAGGKRKGTLLYESK
jgi:hypothetical protein